MIRLLLLIVSQNSYSRATDSRYECGLHGRFEYCVDDIPGCVIGCHCHPGYYFDTDTKICEPNIKLSQHYRRNYETEPNRVQSPSQMSTVVTTTTTSDSVDTKVDEITKDADDLGDWLYNQFFKTIENQVINNTKGEKVSRRSGAHNGKPVKKPQKRSRTVLKKSRKNKRKKGKKGKLQKKLLRITEDDSLFDSSSTGSSDNSDSSSSLSLSSSSSSSSSISSEYDRRSREHGHKKLVILNKKPKPQLPSFIFLPNMDTPFYPPIGLPPPPVPMYPVVPVPPIGPFIIVTTEKSGIEDNNTTTSQATTTTSSTTLAATSSDTTTSIATITPESNSKEDSPDKENTKLKQKGRSKKSKSKMNNGPRKKLLEKLRQRLVDRSQSPDVDYINDYQLDQPMMNNGIPKYLPKLPLSEMHSNAIDGNIHKDPIDFSYLTQLIHKPDPETIKLPSPNNINVNHSLGDYMFSQSDNPINSMKTRRQFNINKPDDTFYSNLGRQIATLIRKMDSDGENQIDIEIEKTNQKPSTLPLFLENIYTPRSYWERSDRSPIKSYIKELERLKESNENLFSIENKVENEARKSAMSLQDLENIINTMEYVKTKFKKPVIKFIPETNRSLNFNLLQYQNKNDINGRDTIRRDKPVSFDNLKQFNEPFRRYQNMIVNRVPEKTSQMFGKYETIGKSINANKLELNKVKNRQLSLKLLKSNSILFPENRYNLPIVMNLTKPSKTNSELRLNPTSRRVNLHYYFGDNNNYDYEKTLFPVMLPRVQDYKYREKAVTPSYFHHELHHFDYFE